MKKQLHQIGSDKSVKQRTELLRKFAAVERNKALDEAIKAVTEYAFPADPLEIAMTLRAMKKRVT